MKTIDTIVKRAQASVAAFEALGQKEVDRIVRAASMAALAEHTNLAEHAVEETKRGVVEDKAVKNVFACEHVTHHMKDLRTAGVVGTDDLRGITEVAAPVGVVCAITPVTNPTSTVLFKALIALKTRNSIIFSFARSASGSSRRAARIVRDAAVAAGAPEHCVQWLEGSDRAATSELMRHEGVSVILATGGHRLVRAAYSSGKPALGVGAGNVPAVIDRTADVRRAAHDIVLSNTFDHGMVCSSEQVLVVDEGVRQEFTEELRGLNAHVATPEEKALLERYLFGAEAGTEQPDEAEFNRDAVGRPASWIAEQAGFRVPADTSVILADVDAVGPGEPLTREKLCPVLAVVRACDREEATGLARQVLALDGLGHTAAVHARDEEYCERFGTRVEAVRVICNSPTSQGGIGGIYNALAPSLTLGTGSYGGNSFAGNVHAVNLLNIKRIARRTTNMQWFRVPPEIYFEPYSLRYLTEMRDVERVSLVTGAGARRRGHVQRVVDALGKRGTPVEIDVIDDVEADPALPTVRRGSDRMARFRPDTIIALGGGSVMDAAKVMWLLYEHPSVEFSQMRGKFFDMRKRVFDFPGTGALASLVCVPTTSGSGSETSPFAVITDPDTGLKYPLADYALTPSVAICDPTLATRLPPTVTADSGFDALTHAIEAYVSVYANDFTDGLCLKAIQLVFTHLERAVNEGENAPEARAGMHNAGTIAGMAFGNAFLGIVHAMSHTLGATFHLSHGRTNALLLPHVIRYNGAPSGKLTGWPKYESHRAPERFQDIARSVGLPADSPRQAVAELARAVEDLREAVGIEPSFAKAGVDEEEFLQALPEQAINAYNDQCAPANPRMPLMAHMEELMETAYYGHR